MISQLLIYHVVTTYDVFNILRGIVGNAQLKQDSSYTLK